MSLSDSGATVEYVLDRVYIWCLVCTLVGVLEICAVVENLKQ
jgi:hypothetical protein